LRRPLYFSFSLALSIGPARISSNSDSEQHSDFVAEHDWRGHFNEFAPSAPFWSSSVDAHDKRNPRARSARVL